MILTGRNSTDIVSGIHGTGTAKACIDASSAVDNIALGIGLELLTLSTNIRTVIDTLIAHDAKRALDTQQLMGDLE